MDLSVTEEILDSVLPSFEVLESQTGAILQFLKDKGIATDEQLAPYLEQSRNASIIRWRAVRLRINRLLAPAAKAAEKGTEMREAANKQGGKATEETKTKNAGTKGKDQSAKENREKTAREGTNNETNRRSNRGTQLKRA